MINRETRERNLIMGYVTGTWLIGGEDPIEPAHHEASVPPAVRELANPSEARRRTLEDQLGLAGGIWEFPALFTLTGALVPNATYVKTRRGEWVWRIGTREPLVWFRPSTALSGRQRRHNDAAKGFRVGTVRRPATVESKLSHIGGTVYHFIAEVPKSPIEIVDDGGPGSPQYRDR